MLIKLSGDQRLLRFISVVVTTTFAFAPIWAQRPRTVEVGESDQRSAAALHYS